MKDENLNSMDRQLGGLLREARNFPALPPRFQENVWRRIEDAELPANARPAAGWLEQLVALILRPRFAFATIAALMLGAILLGAYSGAQTAHRDAEARYISSVAPHSLR
jgi:hypothetical protein